jgi:hypothetical protein
MATGLDLVRMPGFQFPDNAKLDFTPLRQALQHRNEMGLRQSQEERELERLGLDRQRFAHQSTMDMRNYELNALRTRQEDERGRRGLDLQGRTVGVQEADLGLRQTAAQRLEEQQQAIRMANEAWRIRQQYSDQTQRADALGRFISSSPIVAEYLRRHRLDAGVSADQVIDHLISQVPDATERYRPAPLVSAPPGHTLGRQTPEGGFEAVHTTPATITPGDRAAIREADAFVSSAQEASGLIQRALALSPQAFEGPLAQTRAGVQRHGPSLEYHNIVSQLMLTQLRTIFGGNPTEGEREVLAQVQGSIHQPRAVRERILQRALALVQQRERSARDQAAAIRAGTYYQPQPGTPPPQTPPGTPPPQTPPGTSPPAEGTRRTLNGRSYIFRNGGWFQE